MPKKPRFLNKSGKSFRFKKIGSNNATCIYCDFHSQSGCTTKNQSCLDFNYYGWKEIKNG
jgi:hypothetical protein